MTDGLIRKKFPAFEPGLKGAWDGRKRPPADPGTKRKHLSRRYRQFDGEAMSHEQRLIEMMRAGDQQ